MNAHTRMSDKGQVVVPKSVRDRLGWTAGADLEVIETTSGIYLTRRQTRQAMLTVDQAVEKLRTIYRHSGPPIAVQDLNWSPDVPDEL
ncbi:AbrB/MazE/SpoVT family DNA-binding domain-containing protein [Sphingomonas sp. HF-S4]|uniref:AbrB/MazE/SpoVT family DNA-binding domain-containing protein n=1 Tax=Sphingomonas agrestis TaxID=3080540 RepID=A0ABU3YBM6_9SPHN|nr:AbrB/MazE/SpoVT family DNA-binding domain-containing protein [Sphingomonas sp. HF-S4]MDV3458672.1 AbrB/MazE/SpoVT family DNA-binding domain-containing protein [Sphingomonas sp. HF-S4]